MRHAHGFLLKHINSTGFKNSKHCIFPGGYKIAFVSYADGTLDIMMRDLDSNPVNFAVSGEGPAPKNPVGAGYGWAQT